MRKRIRIDTGTKLGVGLGAALFGSSAAWGQESTSIPVDDAATTATEGAERVPDQLGEIVGSAGEKMSELAATPEVATASKTVLTWIESVDKFYHPWVNWLLVAVGIGLFVSHVGQLLLGKIWVAIRHRGWNWSEILNDLLVVVFAGLALPAVMVIPVGYGAFVSSPLSVLSAVGVGFVFGIFLYAHGVRQEALAKRGKREASLEKAGSA